MKKLHDAEVLRTKRKQTQAKVIIDSIVDDQALLVPMDDKKKQPFQQQARRIAKRMVELAFKYPSMEKTTIILS